MIRIGDEVEVISNVSGSYIGEKGIVKGFDTNMFGSKLVDVLLHCHQERTSCFYPYELQIVRPVSLSTVGNE